ncbi:MAG: 5-formyltetrahydrofolate cyclo-ligase [Thiobacillaceae bacterium]|nr:5-formyltetrahydrofolate cyclo-ligase [Thiobacillaceae bacterium]MCX7693170.1 5-formyltetrahydrofolate cyclo-ligase [Tepidimonas taiwanensis]MDW8322676.1 5-formyltetrahydrofolate cyclo-ligase [Burkholderiales bacterium]
MTLQPAELKARLRSELRARRSAVPAAVRKRAGRAIERQALRLRLLRHGRRIGFYIPAKGEVDCLPLINRALWLGAHCYLPVLPPQRGRWHGGRRLWFARLGASPLHWVVNRYGIPEYDHRASRVRASRLDLLFLPMLGFDALGTRMGMGGGFYDASLAFLRHRRHWRKPLRVGLAFEAQRLPALPREPWDVPVDWVITEARVYPCRTAGTP